MLLNSSRTYVEMVNVDGKAPEAEEGDFKGEHERGEVYTAQNIRAIDVIMELFTMLKADKMYGQPGTDGTFWSNILETIKNDNDFISIFYLNKAHPFGKVERMVYFALCIFLNMVINSQMGLIEGINKNLVSLLVSVVLVIVKKLIRCVYEAPCMSHDMAASDLRDGMDPDEVVKKNAARQKNYPAAVKHHHLYDMRWKWSRIYCLGILESRDCSVYPYLGVQRGGLRLHNDLHQCRYWQIWQGQGGV